MNNRRACNILCVCVSTLKYNSAIVCKLSMLIETSAILSIGMMSHSKTPHKMERHVEILMYGALRIRGTRQTHLSVASPCHYLLNHIKHCKIVPRTVRGHSLNPCKTYKTCCSAIYSRLTNTYIYIYIYLKYIRTYVMYDI